MLELRQVSKRYGSQAALRPTDLRAARAAITVLIGPSGSGKSTLLRLIVGLIPPDTGTVRIDGEELGPGNLLEQRRRMGYVIQEGGLFPHLTCRANVTLVARYLGWSHAGMQERVNELAELTRLSTRFLDRYPAQLSGGQRQRVSLMRALMLDPDILLLDEPLAALDPMIRADLQADLRAIFRKLEKTVVMVTHDIGEAGYFGDRLVLLREGRVIQEGTLHDFWASPGDPFVTDFINAQRAPLEVLRDELE